MSTMLLGYEVLAELMRCAPKVGGTSRELGVMVVERLWDLSLPELTQVGLDGQPYYWAELGALMVGMPDTVTAKRLGVVCRQLGLYLWRRNVGFCVAWNAEQLLILRKAFGLDEDSRRNQ